MVPQFIDPLRKESYAKGRPNVIVNQTVKAVMLIPDRCPSDLHRFQHCPDVKVIRQTLRYSQKKKKPSR